MSVTLPLWPTVSKEEPNIANCLMLSSRFRQVNQHWFEARGLASGVPGDPLIRQRQAESLSKYFQSHQAWSKKHQHALSRWIGRCIQVDSNSE